MTYITNADIAARIGAALYVELTDDAGTGAADEAKVTEARQASLAEVDSYLARRYQTPIDLSGEPEVSAVLKAVSLNLAIHRLHGRKPPVPDDVSSARLDAISWLQRVAAAEAELPARAPVQESVVRGILGETSGPVRTMTRDTLGSL